ncbi:MAG: hypothetical protein AAF598_21840 [Bacteroidota bacterium]
MSRLLFLFIGCLFMANLAYGQKYFQGLISYSNEREGEDAAVLDTILPNQVICAYRRSDLSMVMMNGLREGFDDKLLILGKEKEIYLINDKEQEIYRVTNELSSKDLSFPIINKQEEVVNILGYPCQKYEVIDTVDQAPRHQYYWITTAIKTKNTEGYGTSMQPFTIQGIEGIGLKKVGYIEITGKIYLQTQTALWIKKKKPKAQYFKLPEGYTLEDYDDDD